MEETKRRRFIIRAVLEGEVDVSEEPTPPQPSVDIFEGKSILFDKYITGTGTIADSNSGEFATELLPISELGLSYILVYMNGAAVSLDAYRIAFYDANEAFISRLYYKDPNFSVPVPNNAAYIRLGGKYAGMEDIQIFESGQGLGEYTIGEYWSPDDGSIVTDAGFARFEKISARGLARYACRDVFTACYYDDSGFLSAEKNLSNYSGFEAVAGTTSVGIFCRKEKVDTIQAITAEVRQIGYKEA